MTKNITSLINMKFLTAIMICYFAATIARDQEENSKKSEEFQHIENKNRIKRQFGQFSGGGVGNFNNFNNGFVDNNFNSGPRRRGQRPRPGAVGNNFFPNGNNNNFGNFGGSGGGGGVGGGGFGGFGGTNELIFSRPNNNVGGSGGSGGGGGRPANMNIAITTPATFVSDGLNGSNNNNNNINSNQLVFVNNRPTIATIAPFTGRTTPSSQYLTCFNGCATTPEYNPVCGSDMELYFNEQKFNCARRCGADIQIVRRGSCTGLFPMMRG